MIWIHLICSISSVFTTNTKQLLEQHIPLLGDSSCHLLRSFRVASRNHYLRQYHSLRATCAVSLPLFKLRTKLKTMLRADAFSLQSIDNRR